MMKGVYVLLSLLGLANGFLNVRSVNHNTGLQYPPSFRRQLPPAATDWRKLSHQRPFGVRIRRSSGKPSSPLSSSASLVLEKTLDTIRVFSKSNLSSSSTQAFLNQLTKQAVETPPVAYFLALMAAGFGIPVSEDALCLFAGAIWNELQGKGKRPPIVASLYFGVVASDVVTFWLGRMMRTSILAPLASRLGLQNRSENGAEDVVNRDDKEIPADSRSKMTQLQGFLKRTGDWAGFLIRFSLGTRGPLMLLTGFSNQVAFWKFGLGAAAGAVFTLPMQLAAGYLIGRNNPGAVVGVVAAISTFVLGCAIFVGSLSLGTLITTHLKLWMEAASSPPSDSAGPVSEPVAVLSSALVGE